MGEAGERTIIVPTRLNLELLVQASNAHDCVKRAGARTVAPVLPQIVQRDGKNILTIPESAGLGAASEVMG